MNVMTLSVRAEELNKYAQACRSTSKKRAAQAKDAADYGDDKMAKYHFDAAMYYEGEADGVVKALRVLGFHVDPDSI